MTWLSLCFLQEEVCDMINKRYNDFLPSLQSSEELMLQVDAVSKEMDTLKNCIENEVCMKLFKVKVEPGLILFHEVGFSCGIT